MNRMAVAIVNWNTKDLLRSCLQSVSAAAPGEVVVVDNGSSDGSVDMVRRDFPGVRVEVLPSNPGYGAASNIAFTVCSAPYVLVLNSDTELQPGALPALTRYLDDHPQVGVVGPRLVNADGTLQHSCFPFPNPLNILIKRQPFATLVQWVPPLRDLYPVNWADDQERRVPWVVGAALAIRREAFAAVGGFEESFVMYFEEVDLCYRMRRARWQTHFTPAAVIMHVGGASTRQRRHEMMVQLNLSSIEFHKRHSSKSRLAMARAIVRASTLVRLLLDTVRSHLKSADPGREQIAEDLAVWREVLVRTSRR